MVLVCPLVWFKALLLNDESVAPVVEILHGAVFDQAFMTADADLLLPQS